MIHDFSGLTPVDAYSLTQTSEDVSDGDLIYLGEKNIAIMVKAWPVMVEGRVEEFHHWPGGSFPAEYAEAVETAKTFANIVTRAK